MQELCVGILNALAYSLHHDENKPGGFQEEVWGMDFWKTEGELENQAGGNRKCLGLDDCSDGWQTTLFGVSSHRFPRGVW